METVNLILGIVASVMSIISVIWSANNSRKIKTLTKVSGGDNSVNTAGSGNRINNG